MAWDIYGNTLRRGYCEVHPSVPEEYPCMYCMRDIERENERRREQIEHDALCCEYHEQQEREHQEQCEMEIVTSNFTMFDKIINKPSL